MPRVPGRIGGTAIALLCAWSACIHAQLLPTGNEFIVNSYTTSGQQYPAIAASGPGDFIVTWQSFGQGGDSWDIFVRRFSEPTTPVGTEMRVNTYTTDYQVRPEVAVHLNGDFVVVWDSYYQDDSYTGVYAQRVNSAGVLVGTEFRVNTATIGSQSAPAVVADANKFVIVWEDYPDPENNGDTNLFGRRYDTNGIAQGTEFQLNEPNTGLGIVRSLALTSEGFLAIYGDFNGLDGAGGSVIARRFDGSGAALSSEFVVNTYTTGSQGNGQVGVSANGNFVVVWSGQGIDGNSSGVFGQRFDSSGARLGTEFQVNTYTTGPQARSSIAVHSTGEFVVVWQSNDEDGDGYGIFARAFKADGTPDTGEIQVNQYTVDHQNAPEIAAVDDRTVVIVWQSMGQDGAFRGVYGRRLRRAGDPLSGKKLSLKISPTSGNALTFVSKDPQLEAPQTVAEDPRCPPSGSGSLAAGAKLRVVGTGGDFTIDLPCINWSANDAGTRYRYRDATGATCNSIVLHAGRLLKAICRGAQVDYSLGSPQGDVHVVLTTGDPAGNKKYCASFGPETSATVVRDGSDGRSYRAVQASTGACP